MGQKTEEPEEQPGKTPAQGTENPLSAPEAPEVTDEPTAEEREEEEAFGAGFNEARGVEPPAEAPAPQQTPSQEPPAQPEKPKKGKQPEKPEKPEKPAQEAPAQPQGKQPAKTPRDLSPEQLEQLQTLIETVPNLQARFEDEIRKVYGRMGGFQSTLQQLQQAKTPRQAKIAFKHLKEEFPEIAEVMERDMAAAEPEPPPPEPAAPAAEPAPSEPPPANEATERKLLTLTFHTWEQDCNTPEFEAFIKTLPAEDQQRYLESTDSLVTAECFRQFYAWRDKQAPAQEPDPNKTRKQERLERAITPRGEGGPPDTVLDDEAAFVDGFNNERHVGG